MPDPSLWPVVLAMLATSLVAGLAAGLLGVGGGIVLVPVLEFALAFAGVPPEWRMHVAVATSSASIIPTAISSARAHDARGAVDWALAKSWGPGMLIGAFVGSVLASRARSEWLTAIFGAMALLVAIRMFIGAAQTDRPDRVPRGSAGVALSSVIGGVSATMGIGAGTIGVPTMTAFGLPVHRAVGTAAFLGLLVSLPATVGYLLARPGVELPWATVGFVSLVGAALIVPGSLLMTPVGARIAHSISRVALSRVFAVFLLCVALRMAWRTLQG
jgi:uncharacterized membrane protein YfcA